MNPFTAAANGKAYWWQSEENKMTENPIEEFKKYANAASFHYADDSCKEWDEASRCENKAMQIYYANPEHQKEMASIGKSQLWGMTFCRKAGIE